MSTVTDIEIYEAIRSFVYCSCEARLWPRHWDSPVHADNCNAHKAIVRIRACFNKGQDAGKEA